MSVAQILAGKGRDVLTIAPEISISEAVHILAEKHIGALVVTDASRRILGIVSERDVVRAIAREGAAGLSEPITAIMTADVVTCCETDSIHDVMSRMTRGRFRHLPVIEDDQLAGIVSIGDVVKARIEQVETEAEEMRAYIAMA